MRITEEQKIKMVAQVEATRTKDTALIITAEDVKFLVDEFCKMVENGTDSGTAKRLTYACLYRQSDIQFNPKKRIAELKTGKE
jgi:hypothetical protein